MRHRPLAGVRRIGPGMESSAHPGTPPHATRGSSPVTDHVVQFYDSDEFLCDTVADTVARFLVQGLKPVVGQSQVWGAGDV